MRQLSLTGPIPSEFGNLASIQRLNMRNNQLSSSIPSEISSLSTLSWLILSANALTGPIPEEIGSLPDLEELWLQENALSGALPASLPLLASNATLLVFNIGGNPLLTGEVPEEICTLDAGSLSFDCSESLCGCDCACAAR